MATEKKIVIVGAGVSGLTTALLLSQNASYKITIIAKHQPGDMDIEYASPWAGANYVPVSLANTQEAIYDRDTWPHLADLAKNNPESGVHFLGSHEYFLPPQPDSAETPALRKWRSEIEKPTPWFSGLLPDWRNLSAEECPPSYPRGVSFTSVCINPQVYLPYLQSACIKAGVTFRRATVPNLTAASGYFLDRQSDTLEAQAETSSTKADLIINCTGLASHSLPGVMDHKMYPIRGQTVLVQQEVGYMVACADGDAESMANDELCYVMTRGAGGGTILGGSYQAGNWDGGVDEAMTERILRRAVRILPKLVGKDRDSVGEDDWKKLTVVRQNAGLRPAREGGIRIEKEYVETPEWKGWVVHNYGHGGYGYQSSFGCSKEVVRLVDSCT